MEHVTVKWCSECEGEFQYWVEACPDCEVPLIARLEGAVGEAQDSLPTQSFQQEAVFERAAASVEFTLRAPGPTPELRDPILVREAPRWWCAHLRAALHAQGIQSVVMVIEDDCEGGRCGGPRLGVFVESRFGQRAAQVDQQVAAVEIPGAQVPLQGEVTDCPSCGRSLGATAVSCSGCGLEFPEY